jgi:diaminopimelate epimerase
MTGIIPIVYTDDRGVTYTESCTTSSMAIIREEELEAAGYTVIHG